MLLKSRQDSILAGPITVASDDCIPEGPVAIASDDVIFRGFDSISSDDKISWTAPLFQCAIYRSMCRFSTTSAGGGNV